MSKIIALLVECLMLSLGMNEPVAGSGFMITRLSELVLLFEFVNRILTIPELDVEPLATDTDFFDLRQRLFLTLVKVFNLSFSELFSLGDCLLGGACLLGRTAASNERSRSI